MQNDRLVVWAGTLVVLAVIGLAAYVVARVASGQPAAAAGVLTGTAAVLATLPAIIRALRGR